MQGRGRFPLNIGGTTLKRFSFFSVSQSLSHCIGNGTQNGYLENSGKASQMSAQEEGSVASQDEAMTTSSVSFLSTDQEENNDYLFETSRTSDKVEKSITASSSVALVSFSFLLL